MKQFRIWRFSLIFVYIILQISLLYAQEVKHNSDVALNQQTRLFDYLEELGSKYDCYFTVEMAWNEDDIYNQLKLFYIEDHYIQNNLQQTKDDIQIQLEELRQKIPYFTYTVNANNPKIIHVIDGRLHQQSKYGLNTALTNLKFHGTVHELINTINKQEHLIVPTTQFTIGETPADEHTSVRINKSNVPIRDALSNFIKLTDRGRILWIANTKLGQVENTNIHFIGAPTLKR